MMSDFKAEINIFKSMVDDELINIYHTGPKLLKEPIEHITTGGKRLRPTLCLLICKAFNKDIERALISSVSIELLHLFSLVHDDIMDNDDMRHNKLTLHKKWNVPIAILAGDAILALAFKRLNNTQNSIKELFNSALIAVCEGQALDIEYELLDNISEDQYFSMINLKTSHMLGLSAQLGGLLSGLDNVSQMKLRKYGQLLGKAFQIQDDLFEVLSNSNTMGKSLESDFILGKKTLLMIDAKKNHPKKFNNILNSYNKDKSLGLKLYKELLINEGIIDKCKLYVSKTFSDANNIVSDLMPNESLINFTEILKIRKF